MSRFRKRKFNYIKPRFGIPNEIKRDAFILFIFALALFSLAGIFGWAGKAGSLIDKIWQIVFGWAWWAWPFMLIIIGYLMINKNRYEIRTFRWLGLFLFILSYSGLLHFFIESKDGFDAAKQGLGGGFLGYFISYPLISAAKFWGGLIILIFLFLFSILLLFEKSINEILNIFHLPEFALFKKIKEKIIKNRQNKVSEDEQEIQEVGFEQREISDTESLEHWSTIALEHQDRQDNMLKGDMEQEEMFPATRKKYPKIDLPLELLDSKISKATSGDIKANQQVIKNTLGHFGIEVEMSEVSIGPTVTQYTFRPASGVKISQITTLSNDLALALAAHPIRIEAPIPGKSLIGVEVPNQKKALVSLKEILSSPEFRNRPNNLMIALGKDVAGNPWIYDLGIMPHLLIAGATGSGKTVCLNSIIVSLLYQNQPDDLKFILVDPKRVELPSYNNIPHLVCPVICDVKKTINALRWTVKEMDRRFQVLSNSGKRNIEIYNKSFPKTKMPYLVVVVDELADLMATAAVEVEAAIIRLSQMARATGIHLVLATQRPSVDVITGLIKANIPFRIAFSVASLIDSRTILDSSGAEKLLGKGDMLFYGTSIQKKRLQGAFVADSEIERVVKFLKSKAEPDYDESVTEKMSPLDVAEIPGFSNRSESDELLPEAKEIIIRAGKASSSYLQRRLRIGYSRAARILDLLEQEGVVGHADGSKAREVLIRKDDFIQDQELDKLEQAHQDVKEYEEEDEEENGFEQSNFGQDEEKRL